MKKIIFSALIMASVLVSCNQKSKEVTTDETNVTATDTTVTNEEPKTKTDEQLYACSMHPEVQGKKGAECSKCGMALTEPVK